MELITGNVATENNTIETVQKRRLAVSSRAFCGRIADIVAELLATNEPSVGVNFFRLWNGSDVGQRLTKRLTMPEGYVNPVFEARGVAGKEPVAWALASAPERRARARGSENIRKERQLLDERKRKRRGRGTNSHCRIYPT